MSSSPVRPWRHLATPSEVADALCDLYTARGDDRYDEAVTQTAHAVQAAEFARADGAPPALVAAALLHDVGHLLEGEIDRDRDLHHEDVAARFLANWFGPDVTEPIRLHVAAKRYLCAVEPKYVATLSAASVDSLRLQGGSMSADEAREFAARPAADDAIRLRRWDDLAKDPDRDDGDVGRFRSMLRDLVRIR